MRFSKLAYTIIWMVIILFSTPGLSSIFNYPNCSSVQVLNTKGLTCEACPENMEPSRSQSHPNQCLCKNDYYFSVTDGKCVPYSTNITECSSSQFIHAFNRDGSRNTVSDCSNCSQSAYKNENGTGCTPCMTGMNYSNTTKKCQCKDPKYIQTQMGCFPQSYTSVLGMTLTSSVYSARLKYLIPGCYYFKNPLSCSQILNLCLYSLIFPTPECEFFKKANLTNYLYSESSDVYKLSNLTKSSHLKMKLVTYLPEGNYLSEKDFKLADLMRCGLPTNADSLLWIGSNIEVSCEFNFNNLLAQLAGKSHRSHLYQLFVFGDKENDNETDKYYEVNVYINNNPQPVKRFFLEDTFTSKTSINVMTAMKLEFTLNTDGVMVQPSLSLSYTKLSMEAGTGITPASQQWQSLSYSIQFTSELSGFWSIVLPIFIVVNILALIHACIKTYIGYLNRKSPFLFFLQFIDIWAFWMFYFLLVMSGYWFIFTKTTSNLYTFVSNATSLQASFYIVFGLMVAFRLISVASEKIERLKIQVFLINKEKEKSINNSSREIFAVNSLANFCTYRTFSVFWILIVTLFFLSGLKWEQHSREVVDTSLDQIEYFHKKNSILLYFICSSIILVVSIVFKILRRLSVLFWPYPFQDYVDYCAVANISLFFMKKHSPEAFYINTCLAQNTEVTFKQLNNSVRTGLNKNRSLSININQENRLKLYVAYINRDLKKKFDRMIKIQDDHDQDSGTKLSTGQNAGLKPLPTTSKHRFYERQNFIERKLKPALEEILQKGAGRKTAMQSFFKIPPEDLRNENGLNEIRMYLDDDLEIMKEVFPNGDEFEEIHTIIIMFLLFVVLTNSSLIAAFLTYFCDEWIFNAWIGSAYRKHLQKMTRVKEGFMI